jgi:hypothetical protein
MSGKLTSESAQCIRIAHVLAGWKGLGFALDDLTRAITAAPFVSTLGRAIVQARVNTRCKDIMQSDGQLLPGGTYTVANVREATSKLTTGAKETLNIQIAGQNAETHIVWRA